MLVDDSDDSGLTFKELSDLARLDSRIRVFLPHRSDGLIGATKRYAAGLCRGQVLVEMDHDDSLEPNCLQEIIDTFRRHPGAGFVYGDSSVWFLESRRSNQYVDGFAMGFGSYYRQYSQVLKNWVNVNRAADLNPRTLSDSVGIPNHVRAWRADFYVAIGGHNVNLPVADDIDLCMRTFLRTDMVRMPRLGYIQYREPKGNNFTFLRLREIRKLQARLAWFYRNPILRRLKRVGISGNGHRVFTFYSHANRTEVISMGNKIDYRRGSLLIAVVKHKTQKLRVLVEKFYSKGSEMVLVGTGECDISCMQKMINSDPWFKSKNARYWAYSNTSESALWYGTIISGTLPSDETTVIEVDSDSSTLFEQNDRDFFVPHYITNEQRLSEDVSDMNVRDEQVPRIALDSCAHSASSAVAGPPTLVVSVCLLSVLIVFLGFTAFNKRVKILK